MGLFYKTDNLYQKYTFFFLNLFFFFFLKEYYIINGLEDLGGRKRTSVNTVIKYTYSLHNGSDGRTAHVKRLVKSRPVWPNIHRLMQFLRSATACGLEKRPGCKCCINKTSKILYRHEAMLA